jgi:hypothetical protein
LKFGLGIGAILVGGFGIPIMAVRYQQAKARG